MKMVRILLISIISSIVLIGMIGITLQPSQNTYAIVNGNCPNMKFLESHTYGAWSLSPSEGSRLKTLHECVVLEGVVRANPIINDEKDGDLKFGVDPDKKYLDLMNHTYNQKGMVVEVICWADPDYTKYSYYKWTNPKFCDGVEPQQHPGDYPINLIKQGTHVRVIGKHVQDLGCCPVGKGGKWNEIHPVEKIEILK
jgi:hypothetical protein